MDLYKEMEIESFEGNKKTIKDDYLVSEYPLELYVNEQKWITLLCTPEYLEELAIGYLYSEGIIANKDEILDIELKDNQINLKLSVKDIDSYKKEQRVLTSGCGKSMVHTFVDGRYHKKIRAKSTFSTQFLYNRISLLHKKAELFKKTGGVHNTLLCGKGQNEKKGIFRADIGRHNAVDKIAGFSLINDISLEDKVLFSSGRISSEILLKTARAGIPVLASRSAATDRAVKLAYRLGITLISFLRAKRMNVHTHSHRIQ